jgi:hypothetical protein
MSVTEIVKARKCGQIHFHAIYQYPGDLNRILEMCNLKPDAERLVQIGRDDAVRVLASWLHRDAAYQTELMSADSALGLSEKFVGEFSDVSSRFFTNGLWHDPTRPQNWQPLTESTFDGGVVIESGKGNDTRHVCIWFEDED